MKAKRILSVILALAMVMGTMGFTVFADEVTAPDMTGDIINVTAANAQLTLDGAYGDITGKTINFTESISNTLELARPTKYKGSNTVYYNYVNYVLETTPTAWSDDISSVMNSHSHYYRTLENVTFTADAGVTVSGFHFAAQHVASSGYDYVREVEQTSGVTHYDYRSAKNLTFDGLTIKGSTLFDVYVDNVAVENITFDGCTFVGDENKKSDSMYCAVKTRADNYHFKNFAVTNCTISDFYQGVTIQGIDDLTVTNNTIKNTVHNAIAIQSSTSNYTTGSVIVEENYIEGITDRAIRINNVDDAGIEINNNIMVNSGDDEGQLIKATSTGTGTVDLEYNYWDGKSVSTAVDSGLAAPATTGISGGTFDVDITDYVADGIKIIANEDGTYTAQVPVAKVGETTYTDLQEAIKAAAPNGTVEIIADVTVDTWNMFSQSKTIGNGKIITLEMDGLTINGNSHSLTVNNVESAGNGGYLFDDPDNFTIRDLTINIESAGGIGLKSGTVDNVTFNGGNCIFPGDGEIIITNCNFNTAGHVIYYETARDNLTVSNNTFNVDAASNVIILRGNETFTGNTINSGRTVNAAGGSSPTISGNTFADNVRLKIYNTSTATISDNTITVLAFNDESPVLATFGENNMSEDAQAVLDNAVMGTLPNAEVIDLGALTIDEYSIYNGSLVAGGDPIDLHVAMEFIAKDTAEEAATNAFGNYTTDFFITMDGIEGGSFVADGCYLAGNYGTFGWIMIPLDEMTVEEGVVYPVITSVGFDFKYTDICTSVKDFKCGIYFSDDVIAANPDMNVTLTLGLSESMEAAQSAEFITVDEPYTYATADFGKVAQVGETVYSSLEEAIAKANGEEVKLLSNVTISAPIVIAKGETLTIDLGGKNILYSSDVQGEAMISNSGTLVINDETNDGAIVFTYTGEADSNYGKGNYTIDNRGSMTLNGGTIEIKAKGYEGKFPHALYALENYSGFDLTINGGRVYNANNIAIRTFGAGDLTVNDGEIEGLRAIWLQLPGSDATVAPAVNLTVNGGTLTGTGIGESSDNKLAVYSYSNGNDMQNVIINISDGTFNGDIALTGGSNKTNIETVNVTGGTFNGKFGELYSYGDDTAAAKAITITGGTFSTNYAEMYAIDNGFVFKANADGTYGVDENWITDTDAGKYNSGEKTYGMMRFLFAIDIDKSEVVSSGIKYLYSKNIEDKVPNVEATGEASNAFYGDIVEIPENTEGTYYAVAWVETAEKTYWSNPLGCAISFEKFFADYTGGAQ